MAVLMTMLVGIHLCFLHTVAKSFGHQQWECFKGTFEMVGVEISALRAAPSSQA